MSYSIEDLKLILKIISLAERDLRADLDCEEDLYRSSDDEDRAGLSDIGATYLSRAFDEVTSLRKATQKLIEEQGGEDFCQACEDGTCSELTTGDKD